MVSVISSTVSVVTLNRPCVTVLTESSTSDGSGSSCDLALGGGSEFSRITFGVVKEYLRGVVGGNAKHGADLEAGIGLRAVLGSVPTGAVGGVG